uniref:PHD-type domain-containing protein n=1 Tax=Amphimedon queenslandica TaxID=400682 RepID=A0A1X7VL04_AMPQE
TLLDTDDNGENVNGDHTTNLPIYCTCRKTVDGSLMVQCARCSEWFHLHCLTISEELPDGDWICNSCM